MPAIKISPFRGMLPAVDDRLLPDAYGAYAENTWLYSGAARGINKHTKLIDVDSSTAKVFRIPNNFSDREHLLDSTWLEFTHPDTDVIRSTVIGDTFDRYYWASPVIQPMYNTLARIKAGSSPFLLGVPRPGAITVSASGGSSGTTSTRAYVVTWMSAYGEEGPPSLPYLITGKEDDTFTVTLPAAAAGDLGTDRNLTKVRVYRTVTSVGGNATYFLVDEVDIGAASYPDDTSDTDAASGVELASTNWTAPPTDLQGITSLPNGIIAGFRSNEVWFCEPYRMHAWPTQYTVLTEYPIVGLGVVGQILVVLTKGSPELASGSHPASMVLSKLSALEACLSRGSILSTTDGVYYASPNGLILVNQAGTAVNVTRKLITPDKWQKLTPAATLRCAQVGTAYYAYGSARFGVFEPTAFDVGAAFADEDLSDAYSGILVDPNSENVAFNLLSSGEPIVNVVTDVWSGEVLVVKDEAVYWLDIAGLNPEYEAFKWRSKIITTPSSRNFAALKVFFDVPATTPAQNPVRNTNAIQTLAADQYGLVRAYADGELVMTRELRESGEMMRLPSGFTADFWQFEIEARVHISSLQIATSAKELAGV